MTVYQSILDSLKEKRALFFVLIDPDNIELHQISYYADICNRNGIDGFLFGGSLLSDNNIGEKVIELKKNTQKPVILFPGNSSQVKPEFDAILYLSLISGRNPEYLISQHVQSAPMIKSYNIEAIPTAYMLIGNNNTTVEYISNTKPIPNNKPDIAMATALAGMYLGMKLIYLEAGSGAKETVSESIINSVKKNVKIPVIVGGGITSPDIAFKKVEAGADIIITGNFFEKSEKLNEIGEFARAIHQD